ncbi:MAG: GNAT family N-acetyltransferase [Acidobacteriota bacterium]
MTAYFLSTTRLQFRCWRQEDLELALSLWGDTEVTRLIGGPFTYEQIQARLSREILTFEQHRVQYWPIFLLATGEHAGCCGLRPYQPTDDIYELGVHLRKTHWGYGYAQEAAQAVIAYAFNTLGASALFAGHNPANESSRSLLEKLAFQYTHDEFYSPTGLYHPSYLLKKLSSI